MTIITTTKQMRPRDPDDHYPTPIELCKAALQLITPQYELMTVFDPGCGSGVWGRAARAVYPGYLNITGIDTRDVSDCPNIRTDYDHVMRGDFLTAEIQPAYDLVIGNPPYKSAEAFVRKGYDSLRVGGSMVFLLRLAFLASQKRQAGLWRELRPRAVAILGRRPSFTGDRKTDETEYAVFVWQKPPNHARRVATMPVLTWLDWDYEPSRNKESER